MKETDYLIHQTGDLNLTMLKILLLSIEDYLEGKEEFELIFSDYGNIHSLKNLKKDIYKAKNALLAKKTNNIKLFESIDKVWGGAVIRLSDEIKYDIDNLKCVRYDLNNILGCSSKYSLLLYRFLKWGRSKRRKDVKVSFENLRYVLGVTKSYGVQANFSNFILDPSIKYINENMDINVDFLFENKRVSLRGPKECYYIFNVKIF